MSDIDISELTPWIGKQEVLYDTIGPVPVTGMAATMDIATSQGAPLPPLWHWLYFLPGVPSSELANDGHQKLGNFLPPVALERRMWAGGQLSFHSPIKIGDEVKRISTIKDITLKQGSTGPLVFVTVAHDIYKGETLAISEQKNIVYRDAPKNNNSSVAKMAPDDAMWSKKVSLNSVLLFRYSALTFNGHRIHYDRDFAVNQEGYDGLVVHGPLTATLLLNLLHEQLPDAQIDNFQFRGVRPLFDHDIIHLKGRIDGQKIKLWASNNDCELAMTAEATILEENQ